MKLGRNLMAGFANSIWSALIGLAVVPFYLNYLGIEAYGLIGFFVTTQAVLGILDLGMAPTINREVARCSASGDLQEAGKLLHTLAVVYWSMAGIIALLMLTLAPIIAEYWLQSKTFSIQTISHAVMLMGLVVSCRWPIGLYQGALIGAERLTVSSGINIVMATISSIGAVAVLAFVSPTIEAFFIWQACIGLVYVITIRSAAWKVIGKAKQISFDIEKLKSVWRFTAGMSGVAILSVVLMQLDKVLLSKLLSLEDYGRYMLALTLANGLLVLLTPVFNVIYPRLTSLVVKGNEREIIRLYRSGACFLSTIVFQITIAIIVLAKDILFLWTNNISLASNVASILSLLIIGTAFNGVMIFPYALQLAYGVTRLPLLIVVCLIVVYTPLAYYFIISYGLIGGALAWATLNLMYIVFGTWITHRHVLKGVGGEWLRRSVIAPLVLSLVTGSIGWKLIYVEGEYLMNVLLIVMLAIISVLAIALILQPSDVKSMWRKYSEEHSSLGEA